MTNHTMQVWEEVTAGIKHPMHKAILNNFDNATINILTDIFGGQEPTFDEIFKQAVVIVLDTIYSNLTCTSEYELVRTIIDPELENNLEKRITETDFEYEIVDFLDLDEIEKGITYKNIYEEYDFYLKLNLNLGERVKNVLKLSDFTSMTNQFIEEYLGVMAYSL